MTPQTHNARGRPSTGLSPAFLLPCLPCLVILTPVPQSVPSRAGVTGNMVLANKTSQYLVRGVGMIKMWRTNVEAMRSAWPILGQVQGDPEVSIDALTGPGIKSFD